MENSAHNMFIDSIVCIKIFPYNSWYIDLFYIY